MADQPKLRFAPSPNGFLHLGHAYSALLTWRLADVLGGFAVLRIEDIDVARCKPEFVEAIAVDLQWLGLEWPEPVMRQSQRFAVYKQAIERLKSQHLLYPCFCTRAEIASNAKGIDPDGSPLYPGTCRSLTTRQIAQKLSRGHVPQWRLKMDEAIAQTGPLKWMQLSKPACESLSILDPGAKTTEIVAREARPELWGDTVLVRRDTPTSYHLSVVIDDDAEAITHVTRGADLEAATDLQTLLQALLGLSSPLYRHHKLLVDASGEKLSKSRGSPSLASLRDAGWSAQDVRAHLGLY